MLIVKYAYPGVAVKSRRLQTTAVVLCLQLDAMSFEFELELQH